MSSGSNVSTDSVKGVELERQRCDMKTVLIINTLWNPVIACMQELQLCDCKVLVESCPGSFELPQAANMLIPRIRPAAVICIGCVIKGDTDHYDIISKTCSSGIMDVSLKHNIPVVYGVLNCLNEEQAKERAGLIPGSSNLGISFARTAANMIRLSTRW